MKNAPDRKAAESAHDKRDFNTPLVVLDHGEVWTTSLLIAEKFKKRHADVLRAVEKLECSQAFTERNFALSEYTDSTGRVLPMFRISRDGFSFLAMGFTGRTAGDWKEKFISAFGKMDRELRRIAAVHASPDWIEARQLGKADRRELTDAVKLLCERAHERGDSTTPLGTWEMSATRTVTGALFETNGESIAAIRNRLTARQLRRLAMAEQIFSDAILSCLDSDLHHQTINAQSKICVQALAAATGGREVPGVDRRGVERFISLRERGSIVPDMLAALLALAAGLIASGLMRVLAGGA